MREDNYLRVLDHHMLPFWDIRRCNHFMQDGDPAHGSRVVKKWLKDNHVSVLECPRNSPDLKPIENAWNYMKIKVQEAHSTNIQTLKEVLMKLWVRFLEHCERNETQHMYYKIIYIILKKRILFGLLYFCLCYFFCTPYRYIYKNINRYFIFGLLLH